MIVTIAFWFLAVVSTIYFVVLAMESNISDYIFAWILALNVLALIFSIVA